MAHQTRIRAAVAIGALLLGAAAPTYASAQAGPRSATGLTTGVVSTVDVLAPTTEQIPSFDGTLITTNFFPARETPGPTILFGPGWSSPGATHPADPTITLLNANGYNVLTWDPRGFGTSGGVVQLNSEHFEGRDVVAIIDHLTTLPEVLLDGPDNPALGMVGGSYGGGIQLITAAIDDRVDAIVPEIAWHNLNSSLGPEDVYKAGWGNILCALGMAGTNRVAPEIQEGCAVGQATGTVPPGLAQWYDDRGPDYLLGQISAPTLLVQGTIDTLFPLDEAVANFTALRSAGTPVKMVWFCGGHGACLTNPGPPGHVDELKIAWLDHHVKGDTSIDTGPLFEYVDQHGVWRSSDRYPLRPGGIPLTGTGRGTLELTPEHTSGNNIIAGVADNAVNIPLRAPRREVALVGAPTVTLAYRGTADIADTVIYGQLVDLQTGLVVGNIASPIRVRLDGRHRVARTTLEMVALSVGPDSDLALQLTDATALFAGQAATGSITLHALVTAKTTSP